MIPLLGLSKAEVPEQLDFQLSPDGSMDFSVKLTPALLRSFFDSDNNRALHAKCLRIVTDKTAAIQAAGRLPVSAEYYPVTKDSCGRFFDQSAYRDRRQSAEAVYVPTHAPKQRIQGTTAKDICGFFNLKMHSSVSVGNVAAHKTTDAAAKAEALAMQAAPPPILIARRASAASFVSEKARSLSTRVDVLWSVAVLWSSRLLNCACCHRQRQTMSVSMPRPSLRRRRVTVSVTTQSLRTSLRRLYAKLIQTSYHQPTQPQPPGKARCRKHSRSRRQHHRHPLGLPVLSSLRVKPKPKPKQKPNQQREQHRRTHGQDRLSSVAVFKNVRSIVCADSVGKFVACKKHESIQSVWRTCARPRPGWGCRKFWWCPWEICRQ